MKRFPLAAVIQRLLRRMAAKEEKARGVIPARPEPQNVAKLRLPATHQEAMLSLSDPAACRNVKQRDLYVKTSWGGVHPDMLEFYRKFYKALLGYNIPMYAFEFYRSPERQERLYQKGVSKARAGSSPHQYGCAVDVVHSNRYWDLSRKEWAVVGAIGKEVARKMGLQLEWGGDWSFWDPAHWQLADWRDYKECRDQWDADALDIPEDESAYWRALEVDVERLRQSRKAR
jgi:hypothetical protein